MKRLILALSIIILIGCDKMPGDQVNEYTPTDADPENIEETIDEQRKGYIGTSLTEWTTNVVPEIAAGSNVEINGPLFAFGSDDPISVIDPDTTITVADGQVYIVLIVSGTSVSASFTATAPAWDDGKQGYYKTGTTRRYIGGATKLSSSYTDKFVYEKKEVRTGAYYKIETGTGIQVVNITNSVGGTVTSDTIRIKKPCTLAYLYDDAAGSGYVNSQFFWASGWNTDSSQSGPTNGISGTRYLSLNPGDYRFGLIRSAGTVSLDVYIYAVHSGESITSPDVYEINP